MSTEALRAAVDSLKSSLSVLGRGKTPIYLAHGGLGHPTLWTYSYSTGARSRGSGTTAADIIEFETYYKSEFEDQGITLYPNLGCNDILGAMLGNTLGVSEATGSTDYRTLVWIAGSWAYSRKACQINIENPWLTQLYYDLKQTIATIDAARGLNRGPQYNTLEPLLSSMEREWKRQAIAGYPGITISNTNISLHQPTIDAVDAIVAAIKANDSNSLAALKTWKQLIINLFIDCTKWCKGDTIPHYAAPGGTLTNPEPFEIVTHYLNPGFEVVNYQGATTSEIQQTPAFSGTPITETDYFYSSYQSHSTWSMDSTSDMMGAIKQPNGVESLDWRSYHDRVNSGSVPIAMIAGGYTPQGSWATSRYGTKFGSMSYMIDSQVGADEFGSTAYAYNTMNPELKDYVNDYMVRKDLIRVDGDTGVPTGSTAIDHDSLVFWWKRTLRDIYYNVRKQMIKAGRYLQPSHVHLCEPQPIGEGGTSVWYSYNHMWGYLADPEFQAELILSSMIPYDGDRTSYVPSSVWTWGAMEFKRVRLLTTTSVGNSNANSINGARQWAERQLFLKPYIDTANNEQDMIGKLDATYTAAVHEAFFANAQFGDDYWSLTGSLLPWWTPAGGNQGPLASLKQLDDPTHPLYPFLSGSYGHGTTNVFGSEIKAPQIRNAIKHYCTDWQLRHMTAIRNKLKDIYR